MYGYKIKINSLPKLVWACETTLNNYEWKNRNSKDMLEIAFAKFDTAKLMMNNNCYTLKKSALSCVMTNERREAFCEPEKTITIVTVAVRLSDFAYCSSELTETDCGDKSVLLLPAFLENLPQLEELDLIKTLHKVIKFYSKNSESDNIACIATFFDLLYKVDMVTREHLGFKTEKNNYYIKKVDSILNSGYDKRITLESVASQLNISPAYLSAIYKKTKGINFSDRLLNVRMENAEKMLINQNIPTAKVAELCGFCDENYFRKKFKQFFGMNVREYRQIKNGLTLYHEKPQRKSGTY